jgi:hypothetical protein
MLSEMVKGVFRQKTAIELAAAELAQAERERLQAQSAMEYAQALAAYNATRIERLRAVLAAEGQQ